MIRAATLGMLLLAATSAGAQTVVKVATVDADAMPDFRDRLQSALLESGTVQLSTQRNGRDVPVPQVVITTRVQGQGMTATQASAGDYCVGGTRLAATADVRMRDARTGAVVWGGLVSKSVEVGSDVVAGGGDCSTATPYAASYARLTTGLALATARRIAFQLSPLSVVAVDGRTVVLNHGGALVPLGTLVQVAASGGGPARYRVVESTPATATAQPVGTPADVRPGAIARIIEDSDPAANARRFNKVELP